MLSTALTVSGTALLFQEYTNLLIVDVESIRRLAAIGAMTSMWDLGTAPGGPPGALATMFAPLPLMRWIGRT